MRFFAAALVLLMPLALAPGWSFYYDITPKACLLYLGAAVLAAGVWSMGDSFQPFRASREGRWYMSLIAGMALITLIAAFSSPQPGLAWNGSNWRRGGAVTEIAALTAALIIALGAYRRLAWRLAILRALCLSGLTASVYGIAQYLGWDPFVPKAAYEVGEGIYQIVRPPSTLGHSDYFAAFVLWPLFAGLGLWSGDRGAWRFMGVATAAAGSVAVVLSGSRGALLGLAAGVCVWLALRAVNWRRIAGGIAAIVLVAGLFYISPAGVRLRARAFWISEDRTGGARLLLWRDSLRMAVDRPWTGFGPDVFVAEFPRFQSKELARAYPDFYHESPHNMFLDALLGEGVPGMLLLMAMAMAGLVAGWRARHDPLAVALLAGLCGVLAAQQFIVFIPVTGFVFLLGVGLLVQRPESSGLRNRGQTTLSPLQTISEVSAQRPWTGPSVPDSSTRNFRDKSTRRALVVATAFCGILLAAGFCWTAHRIGSGDRALLRMQTALKMGDLDASVRAYGDLAGHRTTGVTADLEILRLAADAAAKAPLVPSKLVFAQLAVSAAQAATGNPEQRQNAWYNLAILEAASSDAAAVEASLRNAIQSSPNWYKPHWMLARVLAAAGRLPKARAEAALALDLDNARHSEVSGTLAGIARSGEGVR